MSFRAAFLLGGLCCAVFCACAREVERPAPTRHPDVSLAPDTATIKDRVPRRATFATLLRDLQVRADLIPGIIETTRAVFDPRRLHAGHGFEAVRTIDGLLRHFEYEIDVDRFLRLAAAPGEETTTLTAEVVPYKKDVKRLSVQGEISRDASSLFAAMEEAGQAPDLSLALADVFSGEIDFNSDLQPGDTFTVAVDRVFRDGEPVAYGPIVAAEFNNEGRRLRAVLFTPPGGKPDYYDEQGRSLRRFFLKSPLKFILQPHVTSAFSRSRFHPVLRIFRPHLGVDYRAPQGAPVVAVATGVVVAAGYSGQGGNMVHLRHASGYDTYYMHLASIARGVRAGAHVSQGQLIGKVGMTGLATGPHLDYRISRNGGFVNPLQVHRSLPPGEPIPARAMAAFAAERDAAMAALEASAAAASGSAPGAPAPKAGAPVGSAPATPPAATSPKVAAAARR